MLTSFSFLFFCFSSRRRHTRSLCDWSSDVCSSDLSVRCRRTTLRKSITAASPTPTNTMLPASRDGKRIAAVCTRSEERRVGKSVDLGGRRIIKKKKKEKCQCQDKNSQSIRRKRHSG